MRAIVAEAVPRFVGHRHVAGVAAAGAKGRRLVFLLDEELEAAEKSDLLAWGLSEQVDVEFRVCGPIVLAGE